METVLLNMCRIVDRKNDRIVVLDKVKKEGWEGLTFPGGHVEYGESIYASTAREIKEETGLDIENIRFVGVYQWLEPEKELTLLAFLMEADDFRGELITENREGHLSWMDIDVFDRMKNKSNSMEDILGIYRGEAKEVLERYRGKEMYDKEVIL